jgi:hypothetical protein
VAVTAEAGGAQRVDRDEHEVRPAGRRDLLAGAAGEGDETSRDRRAAAWGQSGEPNRLPARYETGQLRFKRFTEKNRLTHEKKSTRK